MALKRRRKSIRKENTDTRLKKVGKVDTKTTQAPSVRTAIQLNIWSLDEETRDKFKAMAASEGSNAKALKTIVDFAIAAKKSKSTDVKKLAQKHGITDLAV